MTTMTYAGGGNTANWSDPLNWKGGIAPGAADTALLVGGANSTVTQTVSVNNVMILSSQSVTFDGAVTTYGLGNCKGFMVCVFGTASFAPGSSLADGGVLQIGLKSTGTFVATGTTAHATTLQAERTELGKDAAGIGFMTIDDATLTNSGGLTVGEAGAGTLTILDGGHVTAAHIVLGLDAGASGKILLSSGAVLTATGTASVGGDSGGLPGGLGAVIVGAGAMFHAETSLLVTAGSTITLTGGTVAVGDTTGHLDIMAGGTLTGAGLLATRASGGSVIDGTLHATGGTLELQGDISGTGTLGITAASTIKLDGTNILGPTIGFIGLDGTLSLAQGAVVTGVINGFAPGDLIKMAGVASAAWNPVTDLLTLKSAAGVTVDRLHLGGIATGDLFSVSQQNGLGVIAVHHS